MSFNHFDAKGQAVMVDISSKNPTMRTAVARSRLNCMTARLLCMPMVSMIGREAHSAKISQLRWMRWSSSEAVPASCSSTGV